MDVHAPGQVRRNPAQDVGKDVGRKPQKLHKSQLVAGGCGTSQVDPTSTDGYFERFRSAQRTLAIAE